VNQAISRGGLVLLDFWQAACAPCRALEPRLEAFARRHHGAFTGYRIDIDTDTITPARYQVMSMPTLVWLRDGAAAARLDGLIGDAGLEDTLARLVTPAGPARDRRQPRPHVTFRGGPDSSQEAGDRR
jgi:thioredoxin-like negative regulator of GroEL